MSISNEHLGWISMSRDDRNTLFYGGIALLLGLLGIFFGFESTPFHKTRAAERMYLSVVMLVAFAWIIASTISFENEEVDDEGDTDFDKMVKEHPFIKLLPATLEFTVVTLVATAALLNAVESDIRKFTGSWPLDERFIVPSYSAKRKVQTIALVMNEINKTTNFLAFRIPVSLVPVFAIVYFFFKSAAESSLVASYFVFVMLLVFLSFVVVIFLKNFANNFFCGANVRRRLKIEQVFEEAMRSSDRDELNYIVVNVNLAAVLSEAPTSTIRIFSSPLALSLMSTASKAVVIDALQKRGARGVQQSIAEILFSTKGRKLTKLKNIIDTGSDYHNLLKLMDDMTEGSLRFDLVDHLQREAGFAVDENGGKKFGTKTLSDVDDTLYCSSGKFPVGVDKRLPRRSPYPGVFKFLECIDKVGSFAGAEYITVTVEPVQEEHLDRYSLGVEDDPESGGKEERAREPKVTRPNLERVANSISLLKLRRGMDGLNNQSHVVRSKKTFLLSDPSSCNLVFLSARPHLYKELTEQKSYRRFRKYVSEGLLHKMPTLLPGRLLPGTKAFLLTPILKSSSWRAVGETKFDSFRSYSALYPEYDYVFIGDNGQGDLYAAEKMIKYCAESSKCELRGVFIHQVQPQEDELRHRERGAEMDAEEEAGQGKTLGPDAFSSYVGAAISAHTKDLLSSSDLYNVAIAALSDFDDMRALCPEHDFRVLAEQLNTDVAAVNAILDKDATAKYPQLGVRTVGHLETIMSFQRGVGRGSGSMSSGLLSNVV